MQLARLLPLLLVTLPAGCATRSARPAPAPPSLAERVRFAAESLGSEGLKAVGLDDAERALQSQHLATLGAAAVRHQHAEHPGDFLAERTAVRASWRSLADHYRGRLIEDLRGGQLVSFRLRAQELLPFSRRQLFEEQLDAMALGTFPETFESVRRLLESDSRAFVDEAGRWTANDVGPPGVFRHDAEALIADDQAFAFLARSLAQALYRLDEAGRPVPDDALEVELLHQRARALVNRDRPRQRGEVLRASAAADEAEAHRDRSLDAALDASVAAEQTKLSADAAER